MKEIPAWLEQEHGEAMGERVQLRPCSPATVVKSSGENYAMFHVVKNSLTEI